MAMANSLSQEVDKLCSEVLDRIIQEDIKRFQEAFTPEQLERIRTDEIYYNMQMVIEAENNEYMAQVGYNPDAVVNAEGS